MPQIITSKRIKTILKSEYAHFSLILLFGLYLTNILYFLGICSGEAGIEYYKEAHLSTWNSYIHTIGMPFTYYGISCWVAALFCIPNKYKNKLQLYVWSIYVAHYLTIDLYRGLLCVLYYSYPVYRAYNKVNNSESNIWLFIHGISISVTALVFQEFVGHYLGGDIPSRSEGVLNAILYAPIYSTYHIF